MLGTCRLCQQTKELQESHIIPAFAFRWLRGPHEGYLRHTQEPNRRVQDGLKLPFLCRQCEGHLSQFETDFANKLFYPFNTDGVERVGFGAWLLKFCVSISWRALSYQKETGRLLHFSPSQITATNRALSVWSQFLLGQIPHPQRFEQHFIPFDEEIALSSLSSLPPNINRYLLASIDMDVGASATTAITYVKLGRFAIIGFIDVPNAKQWIGTKVPVRGGIIGPRSYVLPISLLDYLTDRAKKESAAGERISPKQHRKIDAAFLKDPTAATQSATFKAMRDDVKMFGDAAFYRKSS
jgi:hypothetical protein